MDTATILSIAFDLLVLSGAVALVAVTVIDIERDRRAAKRAVRRTRITEGQRAAAQASTRRALAAIDDREER